MDTQNIILVPYPKKLVFTNDSFLFGNRLCICIPEKDKDAIFFTAKRFQDILKKFLTVEAAIVIGNPYPDRQVVLFEKDCSLAEEGYTIKVNPEGINISFSDCAGAFHAVSTLKQIIRQCGKTIPCLKIEDGPDFKARGIMLDISRDKIPTMDTLFKFIDFMSDLKFNQLQFYIEGFSFAYSSFPEVWKHETPVTGEEIIQIETYCKDRFIELVPNQNSFGNMGTWLARKEFKDLAELPGGFEVPWDPGVTHRAATLAPTDPRSLKLVENIIGDLLPYFNSGLFNAGCDETFELGQEQGKSREICEKQGIGRVYLDFLLKVYGITKKHGKRMMFWGDIIMYHPELIDELPKDIIALEWGYGSDHPYEEHGKKFRDAGVQFYVCPGTSAWTSISGRTENMKGNLLNAAVNGKKNGAAGYLITDWGDDGHHQYQPVSYAGFAYGAGLSWNVENNIQMDISAFLNRFVFLDARRITAECFLGLGNYYMKEPKLYIIHPCLFRVLLIDLDNMIMMEGLDESVLDSIKNHVETLTKLYDENNMECEDAGLINAEFRNAARMIVHLAETGKLKLLLKSDNNDKSHIKDLCETLIDDIEGIINEHRRLWLSRNRPGGLEHSAGFFENLEKQYKRIIEDVQKQL